ncbi:transposase [Streptomyces sp. NPDC002559]
MSRARFDRERAGEEITRLVIGELSGQDVVLVADEPSDAKSSTDCVGTSWQHSGAIGGLGLCQVAVRPAAVTTAVKVIVDRALHLPADRALRPEHPQVRPSLARHPPRRERECNRSWRREECAGRAAPTAAPARRPSSTASRRTTSRLAR